MEANDNFKFPDILSSILSTLVLSSDILANMLTQSPPSPIFDP